MPQFDQFSFLNQVIFFVLFFFIVYFLISYFLLPNLNSILKLRQKKIKNNFKKQNYLLFEINKDQKFINNDYQSTFLNYESFIHNNFKNKLQNNYLKLNTLKSNIYLFLNNYYLFFK